MHYLQQEMLLLSESTRTQKGEALQHLLYSSNDPNQILCICEDLLSLTLFCMIHFYSDVTFLLFLAAQWNPSHATVSITQANLLILQASEFTLFGYSFST